jgi:hypothetical protein
VSIPLWVLGPSLLVRAKRAVEIGNGSNGPKADMENCPAVVTRVGTSSKAQPRPRVSSADAISAYYLSLRVKFLRLDRDMQRTHPRQN